MFRTRSALVLLCARAALACGSAESVDLSGPPATRPLVQVAPEVNICPIFQRSLVIPLDIAPSRSASVIVHATDPDNDGAPLSYDWRASSGSFSAPASPVTLYECGAVGHQLLSVRALDLTGCYGYLDIEVNCMGD